MMQEVKDHIEELLARGVIRKYNSPYASKVVLVRIRKKKDKYLMMCVDYRQLNSKTVKDS